MVFFGWGNRQYEQLGASPKKKVATASRTRSGKSTSTMPCFEPGVNKTFWTKSAPPQELSFLVPADHEPGQRICIQGPHGPFWTHVPQGAWPGDKCSVPLGPMSMLEVIIPKTWTPGALVEFEGPDGDMKKVDVPRGKRAGDAIHVAAPSIMVQVPEGAVEGDKLVCRTPEGREMSTLVPHGVDAGQYVPVPI